MFDELCYNALKSKNYNKDIMIKSRNIFLIYLFAIVFVAAVSVGAIVCPVEAYADEVVAVESVKATYLSGFNENGQPVFIYDADYNTYFGNANNPYAKDIVVTFRFGTGVRYYKISCVKEGESIPDGIRLEDAPISGLIAYSVVGSGIYTVTCTAFSDAQEEIGQKSVVVKSDAVAPSLPASNTMTQWQAVGTNFDVVLDWSGVGDNLSGIKEVVYRVYYNDGTLSSVRMLAGVPSDRTYVVINKSCRVAVTVYDAAGNSASKDYYFEMYDTVKPMAPSFSVAPSVVSGRYARSYTITLTYYEDAQSGLAERQHYLMNNVSYEYEQGVGIILDTQKNYSFSFYAMDKTGNRSEYVDYELSSSAFDVKPPYMDAFLTEVDLMRDDGVCYLTFSASDYKESGLVSVTMQDSDKTFTVTEDRGNYFCSICFDCFDGAYLRKIILTDGVGNKTEHSFVVDYFSDAEINAYCKELHQLYLSTDYTKCTQKTQDDIREAFTTMNILLNTADNSHLDIVKQYNTIKNLFLPVSQTKTVIESAPQYASSNIDFSVNQADFGEETFGNSLELIVASAQGGDKDFVSASGFSSGFADHFTLSLKWNGEDLSSPLVSGITVTTGLPSGYLDRNIKLFNEKTGEEIETTVIDNRIRFVLKESTSCALVISGGKAPTMYNDGGQKTVNVFGRVWPLGTFLGVVLGVGGGAILIVVLLLVIGKKRG